MFQVAIETRGNGNQGLIDLIFIGVDIFGLICSGTGLGFTTMAWVNLTVTSLPLNLFNVSFMEIDSRGNYLFTLIQ